MNRDYLTLPEVKSLLGLHPKDQYWLQRHRDIYSRALHLALPFYIRDLKEWVRSVWDTAGR